MTPHSPTFAAVPVSSRRCRNEFKSILATISHNDLVRDVAPCRFPVAEISPVRGNEVDQGLQQCITDIDTAMTDFKVRDFPESHLALT